MTPVQEGNGLKKNPSGEMGVRKDEGRLKRVQKRGRAEKPFQGRYAFKGFRRQMVTVRTGEECRAPQWKGPT